MFQSMYAVVDGPALILTKDRKPTEQYGLLVSYHNMKNIIIDPDGSTCGGLHQCTKTERIPEYILV